LPSLVAELSIVNTMQAAILQPGPCFFAGPRCSAREWGGETDGKQNNEVYEVFDTAYFHTNTRPGTS
jgi:hypothetical protein